MISQTYNWYSISHWFQNLPSQITFITCMYSVIVATCTHQISSSNIFYQWIFLSMFRNGVWKYLYSKRMQLSCFSLFFYWGHEMVILNMWWFVNCFLCFSHLNMTLHSSLGDLSVSRPVELQPYSCTYNTPNLTSETLQEHILFSATTCIWISHVHTSALKIKCMTIKKQVSLLWWKVFVSCWKMMALCKSFRFGYKWYNIFGEKRAFRWCPQENRNTTCMSTSRKGKRMCKNWTSVFHPLKLDPWFPFSEIRPLKNFL